MPLYKIQGICEKVFSNGSRYCETSYQELSQLKEALGTDDQNTVRHKEDGSVGERRCDDVERIVFCF